METDGVHSHSHGEAKSLEFKLDRTLHSDSVGKGSC